MKQRLFILLLCVVVLVALASVSQSAAAETNEVTADGSSTVDVAWDIPSTFSVLIPKRIIFDGSTLQGSYVVGIKGNIGSDMRVSVVPEASATLTQEGKDDVVASVSQTKTEWKFNEISADTYTNTAGSLIAENASAGLYTGDLVFTISLDTVTVALAPGLYDENDVMLCSWEDSGIDVSIDYELVGKFDNYNTTTTSGYYVLTNNYPMTKKVVIPNSVTTIGDAAFCRCTSLSSIVIPNSVTTIGDGAFYRCTSLADVTIPDSVTTIGYRVFSGCSSLASVTIPDSVTSIGGYVFEDTPWLTARQQENPLVVVNDILIDGTTASGNVTIPDSVTVIGAYAFEGCSGLTSVTIPDGVTTIGLGTFFGCTSLANITIPNSVTSIDRSAFYECVSLTSVTIPDSVTTIGNHAFLGCSGLTSVTIPDSITTIGDYVFCECTSLASVTIPDSVMTIGTYAFKECTSLASVTYKGTSHTSKAALTSALEAGGVTVSTDAFDNVALAE